MAYSKLSSAEENILTTTPIPCEDCGCSTGLFYIPKFKAWLCAPCIDARLNEAGWVQILMGGNNNARNIEKGM